MRKSPFKVLLTWIVFGWVMAIVFSIFLVIRGTMQYDKQYPSEYGVGIEYAKLNYLSIGRRLLLETGLSDKNFMVSYFEGIQKNIYIDGKNRLPKRSLEALSWDYVFYISPYIGASAPVENISDMSERMHKAVRILKDYSTYAPSRNLEFKRRAFEEAANTFSFAMYDYPKDDSLSFTEMTESVVNGWRTQEIYEKHYPANNEHRLRVRWVFYVRLLGSGAGLIAHLWDRAELSCTHPLVVTYKKMQKEMPALFSPMLEKMLLDGDITRHQINRANYHSLSKYQPAAERVLSEKCSLKID